MSDTPFSTNNDSGYHDSGYQDSGYHDSYARYQCLDGYPNQPEIIGYAMSDVETAEMNALEASARDETHPREVHATWSYETGYECAPGSWDTLSPVVPAATPPGGVLSLLQAIAHALGFNLTPIQE